MALTRLGPNQAVNLASNVTGTLPVANGGTALTSGFSNGITEADQWRITSNWNGGVNPITANWERNDTVFAKIGTGMSESSGTFTFPSTGIYKVELLILSTKSGGTSQYNAAKIMITENNSSYTERATGYSSVSLDGAWGGAYVQTNMDVTDTANIKVQFGVVNQSASDFLGNTGVNKTTATFTRIGDT